MKKILFLLVPCCLCLVPCGFTQSIGIGTTTPNASSVLDIRSANKGLLIPRMSTSGISSITSPARGLMVYDSSKNQLMVNMGTGASPNWQTIVFRSGWSLNGNSGNTSAEFIGTADNRPFHIRVNNQPAGRIDTSGLGNTFLGYQSGVSATRGFNTAMGQRALFSNTLGTNNTAIGESALYNNTDGEDNVAIGPNAMASTIGGSGAIAIGKDAMRFGGNYPNLYTNRNIAIGFEALMGSEDTATNGGSDNTAIGHSSLKDITNGMRNTAVGSSALESNTTGSYNTGVGLLALASNLNGYYNTATGAFSLGKNVGGFGNSCFGYTALYNNTTGSDNTAAGYQALTANTTGTDNAAFGSNSLKSNGVGDYNTGIGTEALFRNNSGMGNTAVGFRALEENTSGFLNTAVGYLALQNNITGLYNTAVGISALLTNLNSYNTGLGASALSNTTNAQYNTAVGYIAGNSHINGYNNVFLGANTDVNASGLYNVIAIGQATSVTSGSSTARFGNSATVSYGGWAGWSNVSDGRFKTNVKENVPGIEFIKKLRPVTYNLAATELDEFLHKNNKDTISAASKQVHAKALNDKERITYTGFVAQEVEAAAKELGFEFSGVDPAINENDTYGLRYAEFVVPLVKAIQEQQTIIEQLRKQVESVKAEIPMQIGKQQQLIEKQQQQINDQKKRNEELLKRIEALESLLSSKK